MASLRASCAQRARRAAWPLRSLAVLLGLWSLAASPVFAEVAEPSDCRAPETFGRVDPLLETDLDQGLRGLGLGAHVDGGDLAVSLVDLTRGQERYYAGVNDDVMLYAASLPKIAILLAVVEAVAAGEHEWNDENRYRLSEMITISNNEYASWGAELVGLPAIGRVMRDPRYCLYEEGVGGLWVGREFRKGGPENREPLKGLSHAATSRQTARFYTMLADGELVSPSWSEQMLRLMGPPKYHHKFVAGIGRRRGVRFPARKSGTWSRFHADSALIEHGAYRFILVGLADHPDGGEWMKDIARLADDLVTAGRHRRWSRNPYVRR